MPKHYIILEDGYPNRESMKKELEARGKVVLTIKQAVDRFSKNNKSNKMSKGIRVKAAIEHYNNKKKSGDKRLTQDTLAEVVLPDVKRSTASQYLAGWNYGNKLGTLKPEHIVGICEVTGVDANFLYGIDPMEE